MIYDLLPHKYRPDCIDKFKCHRNQAERIKQWIQEFISIPNGTDHDDSNSASDISDNLEIATKCILLTGPPGVGKTSLVYTVASELKLHVVESHPSEKRDSKLFGMLKLTNQKGKINPIVKLFQSANRQPNATLTRRKRRKLAESSASNQHQPQPRCLSLSGDTSIILFDDIDVVFEEDGPFLKSLVDFIKETKRPVILTATQSIDHIRSALVHFEHIHLDKPILEDCTNLLRDICKREKYYKLGKSSRCRTIANYFDCDIRRCLNRIHFYGDLADQIIDTHNSYSDYIPSEFSRLNLATTNDENKSILNCYTSSCLVDLMDSRLNLTDRSTSLRRWLDGKPSLRAERHCFNYDLGEQIRESIVELTRNLYPNELMTNEDLFEQQNKFRNDTNQVLESAHRINLKIKCRIEPPDKEFFVDIVPIFGEIINLEYQKREIKVANGGTTISATSRRSRRAISYLDAIAVYLEHEDMRTISEALLNHENITEPTQ